MIWCRAAFGCSAARVTPVSCVTCGSNTAIVCVALNRDAARGRVGSTLRQRDCGTGHADASLLVVLCVVPVRALRACVTATVTGPWHIFGWLTRRAHTMFVWGLQPCCRVVVVWPVWGWDRGMLLLPPLLLAASRERGMLAFARTRGAVAELTDGRCKAIRRIVMEPCVPVVQFARRLRWQQRGGAGLTDT